MTIKDIAKLAGVSISTVSRVINNSAKVKKEVRERIESIIEETGYRPNSLARELLKNKTNTIGVILPRIDLEIFAGAVEGITKQLNEAGYHILLANTREKTEEELEYFKVFQEKRVDGVLWFATGITEEHKKILDKVNYPLVLVGQESKLLDYPCVIYDNYNAARMAVDYLIKLGHRKIGFVGVPEFDEAIGKKRKEGYLNAMQEANLEINENWLSEGTFEYTSGNEAVKKILKDKENLPTAIFAATDRLAVGVMHYLLGAGYKIPEDISVIGIDNLRVSRIYTPELSTISYDYFTSGIYAANLILDRVEKRKSSMRKVVMDYTLEIRSSTKKIKI